ncbi:hypothetical protein D3C77_668090 [compost metagenome]
MLGGAAVVGAELAVTFALNETLGLDQKQMGLGALTGGPAFQQQTFFAQFCQFAVTQICRMADPDIHIALLGLCQRPQAAHQVEAMNRLWRVAATCFVGERAGQALGLGQ